MEWGNLNRVLSSKRAHELTDEAANDVEWAADQLLQMAVGHNEKLDAEWRRRRKGEVLKEEEKGDKSFSCATRLHDLLLLQLPKVPQGGRQGFFFVGSWDSWVRGGPLAQKLGSSRKI